MHHKSWYGAWLLGLALVWLPVGAAWPAPSGQLFPALPQVSAQGLGGKLPRVELKQGLSPEEQFALPLPARSWRRLAITGPAPPASSPRRLASFMAPGGADQGLVEVLGLELTAEVDAAEFLKQLMIAAGFGVRVSRPVYTSSGLAYEALGGKNGTGSEAVILRAAIWRSGRRLFTVWCSARQKAFTGLAQAFAVCLAGFKLAQPQPEALVGQWQPRCLENTICYTGPWDPPTERRAPGTPVVEHVYLLGQDKKLSGTLQVALILPPEADKQSPQQRLQVLQRYLATKGGKITFDSKAVEVRHRKVKGRAFYLHGRGTHQDQQVELYAFSLAHSPWAAMVWLRTLGPEHDRDQWMRNKRVFQIVTRSLAAMHPDGVKKP